MNIQPRNSANEAEQLRRCVNDLVSVMALPAVWSGGEPSQIADTLLDALPRMLEPDLIYIRLQDTGGQAPVEMVKFAQPQHKVPAHELGVALQSRLLEAVRTALTREKPS